MAEKDEKSASIPWLPLLTLVGLGSGIFFFFPQLLSSRPGGGDPRLAEDTFDQQTLDARLWQDPLAAAIQNAQEAKTKDPTHTIGEFQRLFVGKCIPESGISVPKEKAEEELKHVAILAVMIPGGPYVEDIERRLRSRRAVIEGLGSEKYEPEKDHEIGYFRLPWRPLEANIGDCVYELESDRTAAETVPVADGVGFWPAMRALPKPVANSVPPEAPPLLVPYEWFAPATAKTAKPWEHVLVLWLVDDAFRDAPLARLADLVSWFRLKFLDDSDSADSFALPAFKILGPDNSGTLHRMVFEAQQDLWSDKTRGCLATTHVYSSQAAAAEDQLFFGISEAGKPPPTCKDFIEQRVKAGQPNNEFAFDRTILLDDRIVNAIQEEFSRWGIHSDDHVVTISEEDTYYARALSATFSRARSTNLHRYHYLRGIDGKLPGDDKADNETKASNDGKKENSSSTRPKEQPEGASQADDVRRLAETLGVLDNQFRSEGNQRGIMAVGLLGSDVYDKLELLKALRPILPQAIFFTNHLDARFAHPDEWKEAHNLIVVSENDLTVCHANEPHDQSKKPQEFAPFRDSGQTALFQATIEAVTQVDPETVKPRTPFIFEIGRDGAVLLNGPETGADKIRASGWFLLGVIGCGALLGMLLLPCVAVGSSNDEAGPELTKYWAILGCAILTIVALYFFYCVQNRDNNGEHLAWVNGTSCWPSIAIILFAGLLAVYFLWKISSDLRRNAAKLHDEFGLPPPVPAKLSWYRWFFLFLPKETTLVDGKVCFLALWARYLSYGRFWKRAARAAMMTILYLAALGCLVSLLGELPKAPIRGWSPFPFLLGLPVCLFVYLTFLLVDAIILHAAFLDELAKGETDWPQATFDRFNFSVAPEGPYNRSDLADYWDVLFIARRTEAIGNLIYYPFIILSLLIVSRLPYFANWTWTPSLIIALSIHFLLALLAAWRLPTVARDYRESVMERMEQRRKQNLKDPEKQPDAMDAIMQEIRSTRQGAFAYLWEQPALRALLLPSSGLGLTTLLQYLPH
jgi:hypothetical protein